MKKRLIVKIVFIALLAFSIIVLTRLGVYFADLAHFYSDKINLYFTKKDLVEYIFYSFTCFSSALLELIFLIMLIKGIPFLFEPASKEYHEYKKATSEARKQNKIKELEKKLNALKKDE